MTLRTKTLAAIGATLIGLLLLLDVTTQRILLRSFGELEDRSIRQDVQRAVDALQNEVAGLYGKVGDWSNWDDTYAFIENAQPAYLESNLTNTAFVDLRVNLMVFVHASGRIVHAKAVDLKDEAETSLPAVFRGDLPPDHLLLQPARTTDGLKGILLLPEGVLLVAARPIMTSEGEGPARGTIIMGRYLDQDKITRLSDLTHLSLAVGRLDNPDLSADFQTASAALADLDPVLVRPTGPHHIQGYTRLPDLYGNRDLVLRVETPRDIYQHGRLSANTLIAAVVVVGLVFGLLTLLLVERMVLARVARLSAGVHSIGTSGDFSARLAVKGRDELARLSATVNELLAAVERSRQALCENQRSIATLMSNLPGMAYRCRDDRDWTMEFVSEGCRYLTGFEPEELIPPGKVTYGQLIHPEDRGLVWNEVQAALADRRPFRLVYRIKTATGEEKRVWEQGRGILSETGELLGLEGFIADITDTTRLEAAVRAANEYNRSLIEASLDPLVIIDPAGTITDVNAATQLLIGRTRDELIGTAFAEYVTEAVRARAASQEALRCGAVRDYALEVRHRSGRTTPVLCNASVYRDHTGNAAGVCAALRDITERLQVEVELKRAHEVAAAANSAKSEFLANMSHEIRTPMTAILGYVDLIAEGCEKRCAFGADTLVRHADTVARNAKYLLQLINDILDLSKIEAGKLQMELVRCSLPELLADIESLMRVRATTKGLALTVACHGPIPETVLTDPTRLRQILINLLGNAIKFTEQGSVHLTARLLAGHALQFEVRDTGIGMTPKHITRLFRPFSQGDSSIHRRFGGTGLGLSIGRRLAELLGGGITVESQPGAGSTFRVTVATGPLDGVNFVEYGALSRAARVSKPRDGQRLSGRILLAEDGPDNQRLISIFLRQAGAEVTAVDNGPLAVEAALRALESGRPFDVILMDVQMPVLDGCEATRLLRQKGYPGPIVALTARAMSSDREKCLEAGCNDFATKPIERAKLLAVVAAHLPEPAPAASPSPPPDEPAAAQPAFAFVNELPAQIAALQRCLAENDLATLAALARELQDAADTHHLGPLTECARRLVEAADITGDLKGVEALVKDLAALCQKIRVSGPSA